ncbi:MAG TPA: IS1380 family transposase [Acidimicrobiales bacterium]|nr:IS1380 family transposase [Acidimicrobiales bacterium]
MLSRRDRRAFPLHDRGKVVLQAMLMLAGGGESCADIEHLRAEAALFDEVPSDSTLYRTLTKDLGSENLAALKEAFAAVRADVWRRAKLTKGSGPLTLDIDASLVEIHSEHKEGTGPNFKGGFGFHPMGCFVDGTGEALSMLLRPGNAGANDAEDHLAVLDEAIAQLPEEIAAGHRDDSVAAEVRRQIVVRTDSAGATYDFVWGCFDRNVGFSVTARTTAQVQAAISYLAGDEHHDRWKRARCQDGRHRKGAAVAEATALVDLSEWPPRTRLIIRREPLHPGAQQSLFPSLEYRYWGHYTDQTGSPVSRDVFHRAHAHVEDHLQRLKDSGLLRFPFRDLEANRAWLALVCMAADLVRWFQILCLRADLARAEPKALRWRIFHAPARLVRSGRSSILRILDAWPDAEDLLFAYGRIALIT